MRWEWRTFGADLLDAGLDLGTPTADAEHSDELYLLSPTGENVKVRDGLLDIKVLREIDSTGLQRWEPLVKAPFPLTSADVAVAFENLRQDLPTLDRDRYALEEFVDELLAPSPAIRVVPVHKRRGRREIHGCGGELSEFEVGDKTIHTIAVEGEDPDAVWAAVKALGASERVNTSVPEGLRRLVDEESPRYAVVDAGTNSIKFVVGEPASGGGWTLLVDRAEITRLGEGLSDNGSISTAAIERTVAAVGAMATEARGLHAQAIAAVGTAGLRLATNGDDVVRTIEAATGVVIDVISGEEESRLAFRAAQAGLGPSHGPMVVVDTGGGSTQFTFGDADGVHERFSLYVGAARYTERFGLAGSVSPMVLQQAMDAIAADLARLDDRPAPAAMVGMGGAITNMTAVSLGLARYDPDRVQGTVLQRAEVDRQIELYRSRDADARTTIVGLQPKRAEVILAGACIVRTVMDKLEQSSLTVSDRGLRHGVLAERFNQAQPD